jgi:coenzyme F420-0:L-glutamate ligase/coenzyme F420-1:gamma-L-glutamate ligase
MSAAQAGAAGDAGRVEAIALRGLPEIKPGDDLAGLLVAALRATPGALPLRQDDVLVVTQKIVSKAEGAIVDLTTIEPRPEAVEFAARFDRDPRQIEVVLAQARRVVRMEKGVLITQTPHGFVCANGGVDASNVGPASGSIVTLLPADPDASADRIRAAVEAALGVDVAVLISDSFGRPWRWGITDVAIGVSGMIPLDDLRGTPDADGRIMRSTVRATADEIATVAELAMGKTARRPAALVRGASPTRGQGRIADVLMARQHDLFR